MAIIHATVVEHEGKNTFFVNGRYFEWLNAYGEYQDGVLTVIRSGVVYDRTDLIEYYGTHGASVSFFGLKKIYSDQREARTAIAASDLEVGDEVTIEFPWPAGVPVLFGLTLRPVRD